MKGRRTSFQRFGSMVGVQGSALNKWPRGYEVRRDMDTPISSSPPTDQSDGKGIYNLTLKSNDKLEYTPSEADMGEEVYGCITSGYTKNQKAPKIEYNSDIAIANRRERKAYEADKYHFSSSGRIWAVGENREVGSVDSSCIPTENVPLVANSKFEMKFWDEATSEMIKISKGAGFTSGSLVRPIAFSDEADKMPNGAGVAGMRAHTIEGVPIKIAHAILNRCKEVSLTGSVDYTIERNSKKCEGPTTSTRSWTSESGPNGCPPGTCKDTSGSITLTCVSEKQTTKIGLTGSIDMTAYRYKHLSDVWEDPTSLDLSLNYFYGSVEDGASLRKVSYSSCEPETDSVNTPIPPPTIEYITDYDKQTKLGSGCLVYPHSNNTILCATLEDNLKTTDFTADNCIPSTAKTQYYLTTTPETYYSFGNYYYDIGYYFPDGVPRGLPQICPQLIAGPSLEAFFYGDGWDFSGIGIEEPEPWYTDNDCGDKGQNYKNYKMDWKGTGLKKVILSGACGNGFAGMAKYDREGASGCECDSGCEACTNQYGDLKFVCECQPLCNDPDYSGNFDKNPCNGERKDKCDGHFRTKIVIGKYVGVESYPKYKIYNVAPVPLSTKATTKTEDLTLLWNSAFTDQFDYAWYVETGLLQLPVFLNAESIQMPSDTSLTRFEKKTVGNLTVKCEDWSTTIPLLGLFAISKETECKGSANDNGYNVIVGYETGAPAQYCVGCDGADGFRCCAPAGCGGSDGQNECCVSTYCGIDDPCGYAYRSSKYGHECDGNKNFDCSGSCEESNGEDCGCCGCVSEPDSYCDVICPPYVTCAPYVETSPFKSLGCYGDAHEEDKHEASINLTLEFKLFTEME